LANDGQDTRAIQHYLGHRSIASTVRYTRPRHHAALVTPMPTTIPPRPPSLLALIWLRIKLRWAHLLNP